MNGKSDSKLMVPVERSTLGGERSAYSQESRTEAGDSGRSVVSVPVLARAENPEPEELLHFFTESTDLLCVADSDGKLKRLNKTWQAVLGWALKDLEGHPFLDIVHPDDRAATHDEMTKTANGAGTVSFENRCHCKDGTWMWLLLPQRA